jgi:hypothetical protein
MQKGGPRERPLTPDLRDGARRIRTADLLGAIHERMGTQGDWRGQSSGFGLEDRGRIPLGSPALLTTLTTTHEAAV